MDRAAFRNRPLLRGRKFRVVIIFEHRVIDHALRVEPNADAGADHHDAYVIPFAERFIRDDERISARCARRVVEQAA